MKSTIKLAMKPKWDEIEKVRIKSHDFLVSQGLDNDSVHAFTMVIRELVENSVKYGKFGSTQNKVILSINISNNMIIAEVINSVDETVLQHLRKLDKTLQWIRGFQDPFQAYVERIKQISRKPFDDEISGLGLVRIAYEGNAILDFFLSEDNQLNVSAVSNF
jgi:hypothetical protein